MRRLSLRPAVPIVAALAAFTAAVPVASAADRFALSGGCYHLQRAADGTASTAGRMLRLHATDLGSYLLVTTEGSFLSASGAEVTAAAAPTPCRRLGSCVRTATISSSAPGPTRRRRFGSPRTGLSASARPAPTAVCGSRRRMAASPTRSPATGRPVARGPTRFRSARSAAGSTRTRIGCSSRSSAGDSSVHARGIPTASRTHSRIARTCTGRWVARPLSRTSSLTVRRSRRTPPTAGRRLSRCESHDGRQYPRRDSTLSWVQRGSG